MTVKNEISNVIYSGEILELVKDFFKSDDRIRLFDRNEMGFRLCKHEKSKNITLELYVQLREFIDDKEVINEFGLAKTFTYYNFFKPIGFYSMKRFLFRSKLELTVINEYVDRSKIEMNYLFDNHNFNIKTLTLEENAIIGAFSKETYLQAKKLKDVSFIANALHCDIYISNDGFPQVFLDDSYGLSGAIAAYFAKSNSSLDPMIHNKKIYDKLLTMNLLTALKR